MSTAHGIVRQQMHAAAPVFPPKGPPPVPPAAGATAADKLSPLVGAAVLSVPSAAAMAASPKTGECAAADDPNGPEACTTEEGDGNHVIIFHVLSIWHPVVGTLWKELYVPDPLAYDCSMGKLGGPAGP